MGRDPSHCPRVLQPDLGHCQGSATASLDLSMEQKMDLGMAQIRSSSGRTEHGWNRVWIWEWNSMEQKMDLSMAQEHGTECGLGMQQVRSSSDTHHGARGLQHCPRQAGLFQEKMFPTTSASSCCHLQLPPRLVRSLAVPRAALSSQPGSAQLQQGGTKDSQMTLPEADLSRGVGGSPARRSASNNHMHPPSMKRLYALIPDGK